MWGSSKKPHMVAVTIVFVSLYLSLCRRVTGPQDTSQVEVLGNAIVAVVTAYTGGPLLS